MNRHTLLIFGGWLGLSLLPAPGAAQSPVKSKDSSTANKLESAERGTKTYSGRILDEHGAPIIGAALQVVGTNLGCLTDGEGRFSISSPKAKLHIRLSCIGYQSLYSTISPGEQAPLILHSESKTLEGVVVTGFVKKDKKSFTGSQTTVQAKELLSVGTKNVLQSLEALVPGLQVLPQNELGSDPNARPELNIRGRASFSGAANLPLFVVDGALVTVEYIYDMDIHSIASITVLKDASASALYGAKAAAGVIVITTKPLERGSIRIGYSGTVRFSVPDLSDYHLLAPKQKLAYEDLAGVYRADQAGETQYRLDARRDAVERQVLAGIHTDWLSKPLRMGLSTAHSLSFEGGGREIRYGLALRYGDERGVMLQSDRRRVSGNFRLSYNSPSRLYLSNSTTLTHLAIERPNYGSFANFSRQNPYNSPYDEAGRLIKRFADDEPNPLYEASLTSYQRSRGLDLLNTSTLQLWLGDFRVDGDLSLSLRSSKGRSFRSPLSNDFAHVPVRSERGSMYEEQSESLSITGKLMLSYNRILLEKLYLSTLAGSSIEHNDQDASSYQSRGFYSEQLLHPSQALGFNSGARPRGSEGRSRAVGFFVNANAIWDNRYSLDWIYRYEGSSKFGHRQRFAPFWSIGAGWNLHKESWLRALRGLELLKLRASIGYLGNVSFEPYQALTTYDYNAGIDYTIGAGAIPRELGNPDLKWERTLSRNLGLDLTLGQGRLDLSLDLYRKTTDNLLLDVTKAPSIGTNRGTIKENVGQVENRGIELRTRLVPIQTKDWQWTLALNYSFNRNRILHISDALRTLNEQQLSSDSLNRSTRPLPLFEEGESLTALKVVPSLGIDPATGRELYVKRDGSYSFVYDPNDRRVFGDTAPSGYGTISSYLFWRRFSINAHFGYSLGAKIYNATLATRVEGANPRYNADERVFTQRWRQPGDLARFRRIDDKSSPYQTSRFVETEHYLTLRSLSLAYESDAAWLQKWHLRKARIELLANDLFYLSTVKRERGLDYPYARSLECNLRLSF